MLCYITMYMLSIKYFQTMKINFELNNVKSFYEDKDLIEVVVIVVYVIVHVDHESQDGHYEGDVVESILATCSEIGHDFADIKFCNGPSGHFRSIFTIQIDIT